MDGSVERTPIGLPLSPKRQALPVEYVKASAAVALAREVAMATGRATPEFLVAQARYEAACHSIGIVPSHVD